MRKLLAMVLLTGCGGGGDKVMILGNADAGADQVGTTDASVQTPIDAGSALDAATCSSLVQSGKQMLDALLTSADRACAQDGDCLQVRGYLSCTSGCYDQWISDAGIAAQIEALNTSTCGSYQSLGCPPAIALPCDSPPPVTHRCANGQCVSD